MTLKKNTYGSHASSYPTLRKRGPSKRPDKPRKSTPKLPTTSDQTLELPLSLVVKETTEVSRQQPVTTIPPKSRFFLQLEKGNLLTCLAYGLIYPANMETRQRGQVCSRTCDLQSQFPNHLTLTPAFTVEADERQVLVEVALCPSEVAKLVPVGATFLYDGVLPVSRVKSIWVKTNATADNLLASAKTYSDIPFPTSLLHTMPPDFPTPCLSPELTGGPQHEASVSELTCKKVNYDRTMGMLAFMRNAERYFFRQTKRYCDLGANYLAILSRLNHSIQPPDQTPEQAKAADFYLDLLSAHPSDPFFSSLLEVITRDGIFDKITVKDIVANHIRRLDEQSATAATLAYEELFDDDFKGCIQRLQTTSKLWNLSVLAVLYRFRRKDSEDKLTVKQLFPNLVADPKKAEVILALLGLYYGYAALPKHEEIPSLDPDIAALVGPLHPVKFNIESALDRVVVETIYGLTFYGTKSATAFDFLPAAQPSEPRQSQLSPVNKQLRTQVFTLLGTPIRIIEVADPVQTLIKLIRETYSRGTATGYLAFFAARRVASTIVGLHFTPQIGLQIEVDTEAVVKFLSQLSAADLDEASSCVEMDRALAFTRKR
jgi:hypothetical protein